MNPSPDTSRQKSVARMAKIDAMPKEIRELIHEEGLTVIQGFLDHGVKKAYAIRHLISLSRRGSIDVGTGVGGFGFVSDRVMCSIPMEPTPAMIDASMNEVSGFNVVVDKVEKHRRRLRAAIKAGAAKVL